jgi:glyoxylase-like metal-dependent hydrolase (beta-lactamase superfamily II)
VNARPRFQNPWPTQPPPGHNNVLRWALAHRFLRTRESPGPVVRTVAPSYDAPRAAPDALTVTWLGHSTVLVQIGGVNVLTDPVWSNRASPLRFAGPRRRLPPAVALGALPPIDVVLISHNHYDHLDLGTVRQLARRFPGSAGSHHSASANACAELAPPRCASSPGGSSSR